MKEIPSASISELCQKLLGTSHPEDAVFSSFCLDEGEALRLGLELGLLGSESVLFRFDPSSFRGWGDSRLLPVKWLNAFKPQHSSFIGHPRLPPIFHSKICVLKSGKKAGIIIGTGNIGTDDLRRSANLHCAVVLKPTEANRAIAWVRKPAQRPTLAVIAVDKKPVYLEITKESSWVIFQRLRKGFIVDHEEWEMVAPFWSPSMMKQVTELGQARITAFFRDKNQARQVAGAYMRHGMECLTPDRQQRFHHKVLAWRGWRGRRSMVILYIGSANLTSAGFLGVPTGTAYNWEAGNFLVGDSSLWLAAQRAVRGGISKWKRVPVRRNDGNISIDDEIAPEAEADQAGRLLLWLSRMLSVAGNKIRFQLTRLPAGCRLKQLYIILDGKARLLDSGKVLKVPAGIRHAHAEGHFRFEVDGSVEMVELELPEVTVDPSPLSVVKAVDRFRGLLNEVSGGPLPADDGIEMHREEGSVNYSTLATDIRFPYQEFFRRRAGNQVAASYWLRNILNTKDKVPEFWRQAARYLIEALT